MKEAGLTHGGYYKHFDSRDDLVAEAVDAAIEQGQSDLDRSVEGAADPLAAAHMEGLLGGGEDARRKAIAAVTSMVGAVLISRAIDDAELSEEILTVVRAEVENS